jgi:hypothetical protein
MNRIRIPSREEIMLLLDRLDTVHADELESEVLEIKPWEGA